MQEPSLGQPDFEELLQTEMRLVSRWVHTEDTLSEQGGAGRWRSGSRNERNEEEEPAHLIGEITASDVSTVQAFTEGKLTKQITAAINAGGEHRFGYPGSWAHALYTRLVPTLGRYSGRVEWVTTIGPHLKILDLKNVTLRSDRNIKELFGVMTDSADTTIRPSVPGLTHLRLEECDFVPTGGLTELYAAVHMLPGLTLFSVTATPNMYNMRPKAPAALYDSSVAIHLYVRAMAKTGLWPFQELRVFFIGGTGMANFPTNLIYVPLNQLSATTQKTREHMASLGALITGGYPKKSFLPNVGPIDDDERWFDTKSFFPSLDWETDGEYETKAFPGAPIDGKRIGYADFYPRLSYISLRADRDEDKIWSHPTVDEDNGIERLPSIIGMWMEKVRRKALEGAGWNSYGSLETVVDCPDFFGTILPLNYADLATAQLLNGEVWRPWRLIHAGLNLRDALDDNAMTSLQGMGMGVSMAPVVVLASHGRPANTIMKWTDKPAHNEAVNRMFTILASSDDSDTLTLLFMNIRNAIGAGRSPYDGRGMALFLPPKHSIFSDDYYDAIRSFRALDRVLRLSVWKRWFKDIDKQGIPISWSGSDVINLASVNVDKSVTLKFNPLLLTHLEIDNLVIDQPPTLYTRLDTTRRVTNQLLLKVVPRLRNLAYLGLRARRLFDSDDPDEDKLEKIRIKRWLDYLVNPAKTRQRWVQVHKEHGFWPMQELRFLRLANMGMEQFPEALLPQPITDSAGGVPRGNTTNQYLKEHYYDEKDFGRGNIEGKIFHRIIDFDPVTEHGRFAETSPRPRKSDETIRLELWPTLNHVDLHDNNLMATLSELTAADNKVLSEARMDWLWRWVDRGVRAADPERPGIRWQSLALGPEGPDVGSADLEIKTLAKLRGAARAAAEQDKQQSFGDWTNEPAFVWGSQIVDDVMGAPMLWSHSTLNLRGNPVDLREWSRGEIMALNDLRIRMYASHITWGPSIKNSLDDTDIQALLADALVKRAGFAEYGAAMQVATLMSDRGTVLKDAVKFIVHNTMDFQRFRDADDVKHNLEILYAMAGRGYYYDVIRSPTDMPGWRGRGISIVHDDSDAFELAVIVLCAIDAGRIWTSPSTDIVDTPYGMGRTPRTAYGLFEPSRPMGKSKSEEKRVALEDVTEAHVVHPEPPPILVVPEPSMRTTTIRPRGEPFVVAISPDERVIPPVSPEIRDDIEQWQISEVGHTEGGVSVNTSPWAGRYLPRPSERPRSGPLFGQDTGRPPPTMHTSRHRLLNELRRAARALQPKGGRDIVIVRGTRLGRRKEKGKEKV